MRNVRRYSRKLPKSQRGYEFITPFMKCDTTTLFGPMTEFVKQEAQAGDGTYWTGAIVINDPHILDPLDDQLRVPPIKADPYPIRLPRPYNNPNGFKS